MERNNHAERWIWARFTKVPVITGSRGCLGIFAVFIQEQGFSVIRFNDFESNNTKISGN